MHDAYKIVRKFIYVYSGYPYMLTVSFSCEIDTAVPGTRSTMQFWCRLPETDQMNSAAVPCR